MIFANLRRRLETQRTMLRAVGHDLRTPLTSLRIRSEGIPVELQRDKFIATIDDMTSMIEEILSWTKNASGLGQVVMVQIEDVQITIKIEPLVACESLYAYLDNKLKAAHYRNVVNASIE